MQDTVQKGKYGAVSSNVGTFDKKSLDIICKIQKQGDISMWVKEEKSWLRKEMLVPNGKCSTLKEDMTRYEDLIFNSPDGHAILDNNNFILSSGLATSAGRRWLHYSILVGITKILQSINKQVSESLCGGQFTLSSFSPLWKDKKLKSVPEEQTPRHCLISNREGLGTSLLIMG